MNPCPICGAITGQHIFSFDERAKEYYERVHNESQKIKTKDDNAIKFVQ